MIQQPTMTDTNEIPAALIPRFAVLLAAFNGVFWLDEQLDSLLNQAGVAVQIFVSIDPSTDGTEQLLSARSAADPRIVLLPQNESPGGAAANFYRLLRDVPLDNFDYLACSDQDDIWLPDKLLRAHTQLKTGDYAAYSSNVTAFWPDGREQLINKDQPMRDKDFLFEAAGPGSTYVFKQVLAQDLQNFVVSQRNAVDRVALHDWLFYAFARSHGYGWFIDSDPGLLYRQHATNHLGVNAGIAAFKFRYQRIASGWYRDQVVKIARLCCQVDDPFLIAINSSPWQLRWFIVRHIGQCRRRLLDRAVLSFCCLSGLF